MNKLILLLIIGIVFVSGCDKNIPDDVKELKELTKVMDKKQKVEIICKFYEIRFDDRDFDCKVTREDPLDCKKYPLLCIFGFDGLKGGDISYYNEEGMSVGRCDLRGDRCIYLAEDFEHYFI